MTSLFGAARWCAPFTVAALVLMAAPAASAVPPEVRPSVGTHASQTPIEVSFVSNEPVTIHYTTNGSAPTTSSPTYTGTPLRFTTTTVLKWLAIDADGETASGEETYTIDNNPPSVTIAVPADGATFIQYSPVKAYYWCADAEINWTSCEGTVPYEGAVDTSTPGQKTFTVIAHDSAGNRTVRTSTYTVHPATQGNGGVGGNVPATLSLTLGSAPSFGPFTPGVARDYTATTTANVISTAGNATMSVSDPSSFHTGHLVNGQHFLPQRLQASGGGPFNPVGGSEAPTTLKTYDGPVSNDSVTVTLRQSIAANDALRTGTYSKTLTFTLSTTQP